MSNFYSVQELKSIGLKKYGSNVLISKDARIYSPEKIEIGNNVRIDDFCILSGNIKMGDYVHIASYVALFAGDVGIVLDDFVGISSRSVVYAVSDDYSGEVMTNPMVPEQYKNIIEGKIVLYKHVLIGSGCTILPGIKIGEGTSVGSMSLINKSLDEWGIYVGIPCKKIKERSKKLLELERELKNKLNMKEM